MRAQKGVCALRTRAPALANHPQRPTQRHQGVCDRFWGGRCTVGAWGHVPVCGCEVARGGDCPALRFSRRRSIYSSIANALAGHSTHPLPACPHLTHTHTHLPPQERLGQRMSELVRTVAKMEIPDSRQGHGHGRTARWWRRDAAGQGAVLSVKQHTFVSLCLPCALCAGGTLTWWLRARTRLARTWTCRCSPSPSANRSCACCEAPRAGVPPLGCLGRPPCVALQPSRRRLSLRRAAARFAPNSFC